MTDLLNINVRLPADMAEALKNKAKESDMKIAWILEAFTEQYLNNDAFAKEINNYAAKLKESKGRKERSDKGQERGSYSKVEKIKVGDKWYTAKELEQLGVGK